LPTEVCALDKSKLPCIAFTFIGAIKKIIEKKIDKIGNQIFLKNNQVEKELFLENLSLFQWSLKKTFLKR